MISYQLSFHRPAERIIELSLQVSLSPGTWKVYLPLWRPGRYEAQRYDLNFADLHLVEAASVAARLEKTTTHTWELNVKEAGTFTLAYAYFATTLDAGSSYFDHDFIYVNGINLFLGISGMEDAPCQLQMELPDDYILGGGMPAGTGRWEFDSYHTLVDTPFLASKSLRHHQFEVEGVATHLWFQGNCHPDFVQIEKEFRLYTEAQIQLFGEFPKPDYHYLFLMLPYPYRHGVEHHNSTVIVMGPGSQLMRNPRMFQSFLEISSHELFHTWNVKAIRPADMFPYRYEEPNYSRLHYVTEGVTTYYGDLMLWKGRNWNLDQWVSSINGELRMHYGMGGHPFVSLSDASFDSWTRGYKKEGFPNRRISFYTKGYLVAMLLDQTIRKLTEGQHSLDDVIHAMYHHLAKAGKAYTAETYQTLAEVAAGQSLSSFFEQYIHGTRPLEEALKDMADFYGFTLGHLPLGEVSLSHWGIKGEYTEQGTFELREIHPNSPLTAAGVGIGDELTAINGLRLRKNLNEQIEYSLNQSETSLHFYHLDQLKEVSFPTPMQALVKVPQFFIQHAISEGQKNRRQAWQQVAVKPLAPISLHS
ncbi:MAG: hypothetical protein AAFR61_00995 [Bacteroidota bacterium]